MNERLEDIAYNVGISIDGEKALMSSDDYDFLYKYALEQAERVKELEKRINKDYQYAKNELSPKIIELEQQNKRYREALEEIKEGEKVTSALSNGQVAYTLSGHIARKALEE